MRFHLRIFETNQSTLKRCRREWPKHKILPTFRSGVVYYAKAMFARYSLLLSIFWLTIPFRTVLGEDMISETQKLTYPFTSDSRFQLSNQNGSVQIVGDDINEVRIEATKKAHSQFELAAIRISVEQKEQTTPRPRSAKSSPIFPKTRDAASI
jgi:hypothetical protein